MSAISVAFASPQLVELEMPESMHPSDRRFLTCELHKISTEVVKAEGKLDAVNQRLRAVDARLAKLELRADSSGAHNIESLQRELDKTQAAGAVWRGRVWSIVATFLTTALIALVAYYLKG